MWLSYVLRIKKREWRIKDFFDLRGGWLFSVSLQRWRRMSILFLDNENHAVRWKTERGSGDARLEACNAERRFRQDLCYTLSVLRRSALHAPCSAYIPSLEFANYCADHSLDLDICSVEIHRLHFVVGWLEANAIFFFIEAFQCRMRVFDKCNDDIAIFWYRAAFNDDVVAVKDAVFDHGTSLDFENKGFVAVADKGCWDGDGFVLRDCFDRLSGGDEPHEREEYRASAFDQPFGNSDRCAFFVCFEIPFFTESLHMFMDGCGRGEAKCSSDFAVRWSVVAFADDLQDVIKNFALFFCQSVHHRVAGRCFVIPAQAGIHDVGGMSSSSIRQVSTEQKPNARGEGGDK